MPDSPAYHLDIFIDELTNSIRHVQTGESFDTEVFEITIKDLADVRKRKGEWHFHWRSELKQVDRKVYKLVITGQPNILQGLVSVSNMGDHYYLHLAESAPMNFGEDKIYEGVGGNLFAFCCKLSLDNGNEGFIAFKSKTTLISHYEKTLGAVHIGNHQMIIYPNEALFLIDKYFKNRKK